MLGQRTDDERAEPEAENVEGKHIERRRSAPKVTGGHELQRRAANASEAAKKQISRPQQDDA